MVRREACGRLIVSVTAAWFLLGEKAAASDLSDPTVLGNVVSWGFTVIENTEKLRPTSLVWGGAAKLGGGAASVGTSLYEAYQEKAQNKGRVEIVSGLIAAVAVDLKVGESIAKIAALACRAPSAAGAVRCLVAVGLTAAAVQKLSEKTKTDVQAAVRAGSTMFALPDDEAAQALARKTLEKPECDDMSWYEGKCEKTGTPEQPEAALPAHTGRLQVSAYSDSSEMEGPVVNDCQEELPLTAGAFATWAAKFQAGTGCRISAATGNASSAAYHAECGEAGSGDIQVTASDDTIVWRAQDNNGGKVSVTYSQCPVEDQGVDCSFEGQKAMHQAGDLGANYACPNPYPPSAFE